jgi:hypothetical protein
MRSLQTGRRLQRQVHGLVQRQDAPDVEHLGEELASKNLEGDVPQPLGGPAHSLETGDIRMVDAAGPRKLVPQPTGRGCGSMGLSIEPVRS